MNKRQKRELIILLVSLFLFLCLILINDVFNVFHNNEYIKIIIYILVYLFISYDIIIKAFKNIFSAQFLDENFLMFLATIGAFILGEYNEALAVILFYQVGEFFQSYAVNKSRNSISDLMELAPEYANLIVDDEIKKVDPSEVNIGDILLVKAGEKIPVDGVIIEGDSSLDVRALTGESVYKDVSYGSIVLSGMININGTIKIKAEKEYVDSTASKILELVENASSVKSNPEKFITKFAKFYTPIVVFFAVLLAVIPSIITGNYNEWIYRALNFLVVSCPCALVISIPLSFFTGIGKASKIGLLIKGSSYIEKFNKVKTFVFDKTGTITKGNFVVSKVITNEDEEDLFKCAVIAESNSNHPIACSIREYYITKFKQNDKYLDYQIKEIAGKGIIAINGNEEILCGNEKLLLENGIESPLVNELGTCVYVVKNKKYLGAIVISDEIKANAYNVINYLNGNNYKSIMLSGDNEEIVEFVKEKLNISKAYSSLLPHEKLEKMDEIKENNNLVCFIGDGINDAPSLMKADVGIAMGLKGSDAAIESSDIVIMDDNLDSIVKMKKLSKMIMRIVYQNIILALGIKILVLIFSTLGLSSMWMAIFADVGVAVLAILNALRINLFKN